jgi:hypothetical protein
MVLRKHTIGSTDIIKEFVFVIEMVPCEVRRFSKESLCTSKLSHGCVSVLEIKCVAT